MERFEDALTLLDQGDTVQATARLAHLVAQTPAHATVHVLLAKAYEQQHRWDDALKAWQTAYLLLPDVPLVQQGSLRAARVLAALRTMTAPAAAPAPPPAAPAAPPGAAWEQPEVSAMEAAVAADPAPAEDALWTPSEPPPSAGEAGVATAAGEDTPAYDAPTFDEPTFAPEVDEAAPEVDEAAPPVTAFTETFVDLDYEVIEDGDDAPADSVPATDATVVADDSDEAAIAPEAASEPGNSTGYAEEDASTDDVTPVQESAAPPTFRAPEPVFELPDDEDVFFDPPLAASPLEAQPAAVPDASEAPPAESDAVDEPATGPDAVWAPEAAAEPDAEALPAWERPGIVLPEAPAGSVPSAPEAAQPDDGVRGPYEPFDLDDLIAQLSGAGRIVPSATPPPPPPQEEDEDAVLDSMVSPTLARIHAAQGQFAEAARIYDRLAAQEPARADEYRAEAAALRAKAAGA